jgi:putative endonuclease
MIWCAAFGSIEKDCDPVTKDHSVKMLVWYEQHETRESAFVRERQMKNWNRAWKLREIEAMNPTWRDLWESLSA